MSFNVPKYDSDLLSFGPGVVWISAVGTTPRQNEDASAVGAIDEGMTLAHAIEVLDVQQGNPRRLIKSFRTSETVTFAFAGFEWKMDKLPFYLGAGTEAGGVLKYGGDIAFTEVSLQLQHQTPPIGGDSVGSTILIDIWRARSNGDLSMTFGADLHSFPVTFTALQATQDFLLNPLAQGEEYYKMTMQVHPGA